VQLGLIGDRASQRGGAVVFANEGQAAEPGRPVLVEVALDPELVVGGRVRPGVACSWRNARSGVGAARKTRPAMQRRSGLRVGGVQGHSAPAVARSGAWSPAEGAVVAVRPMRHSE